jgi:5-methylcytosine-specific restriction endonuclease McrA
MRRRGRQTRAWLAFRRQYLAGQRNHQGYYICARCERWIEHVELDHIEKRSTAPERRLDRNNVRVLCAPCHRVRHQRERRR